MEWKVFRVDPLRERLASGQRVFGCFSNLASPVAAELAGLAGYDFVLIDGEHGPGSHAEHRSMAQAIAGTPASAAIRVGGNDAVELKRAADLGVACILVPEVQTADEARRAIDAVYYPPRGKRSCGAPLLRAAHYGLSTESYLQSMQHDGMVMAMLIETVEGVRNAAAIAAVDGVDVIFVGPYDIAATLGVLGQIEHPEVKRAVAEVETAALRAGKVLGGLPYGSVSIAELCRRGYQFIVAGSDIMLLRDCLAGTVGICRDADAAAQSSSNRKPIADHSI